MNGQFARNLLRGVGRRAASGDLGSRGISCASFWLRCQVITRALNCRFWPPLQHWLLLPVTEDRSAAENVIAQSGL